MSREPNPARGVGRNIRVARRALGWSRTELVNRAQVSRPTIARVETGVNISTGTLERSPRRSASTCAIRISTKACSRYHQLTCVAFVTGKRE